MPLWRSRRYLGRIRMNTGPCSCPMRGEWEENLLYFPEKCGWLRDLKNNIFGVDERNGPWVEELLGSECL